MTANNTGGTYFFDLVIIVNDQPPANLTYSSPNALYTVAVPITPNRPNNLAGTIQTYGISPALPSGLSFNTTSGWITGTPTALFTLTTYTITGTNTGGTSQATVTIAVIDRKSCYPSLSRLVISRSCDEFPC